MSTTLNYAHPYISIQIYDNTEFVETEVTEERKEFNGMQVGFFAGGRDNKLLYMQDQTKYLREFGNPNFKNNGQAAYNADNALSTGSCGMYILNLRPDTATYANSVIMVKFKVVQEEPAVTVDESGTQTPGDGTGTTTPDGGDGSTTTDDPNSGSETIIGDPDSPNQDVTDVTVGKKLVYSFYSKTIEGANTKDKLLEGALNLMSTDPDEQGFFNMPLAMFYAMGRGDYGNNIRLSFSNITEYVTENEFYDISKPKYHLYRLSVMEAGSTGLIEREYNTGTFDEDGFDASFEDGPSTFLADVANDIERGSERINIELYTTTLNAICALYNNNFADTNEATPATLDILTGLTLDGSANKNLVLDDTQDNYINLFSIDGFSLSSGSDGWDSYATEEELTKVKEDLLIKAYAGEIDPFIKSRFSSPCNFNMDANYNLNVKKQMAALAVRRKYDCMTYLDTGLTQTTTSMISVLTALKNVYGFNVVKECHCYKWRDVNYTGKLCNMTMTHWLSKALPRHMAMNDGGGLTAPLAREMAILTSGKDYVAGSFKPVIDPDSDDIKNTIYRLRGNCYETLTFNSVQRSTAITSCPSKSDRLLEMNEFILQKGISIAYRLISSKIYKLGEADDRAQYETDATDIINYELADYVRSASVSFEMTSEDEKKSLLRLVLRMTFKTVIQNGEVKVYLDPRVTSTGSSTTSSSATVIDEETATYE